jgi:GTP-binding nuclear protein Ran
MAFILPMSQPQQAFKCVFFGDGECGKTTFILRHLTGEFTRKYDPTIGFQVHPLIFATSHGPIRFNVWDTAGQEQYSGLRTGYYIQADCAILMFDLTKRESYAHLEQWYHDIVEVCGKIPIVLVGNKVDLVNRQVLPQEITFHREHSLQYYDVSAKSNFHLEKPFLWLARELTHNPHLAFVEEAAIVPHEVTL